MSCVLPEKTEIYILLTVMLFDKEGVLRIDEAIMKRPTFLKILEDNVVTDEEIFEQSRVVLDLLQKAEKEFSPSQLQIVEDLLAETGVLFAISRIRGMAKTEEV